MRQVKDGLGVHRSLAGWKRDIPKMGDPLHFAPTSALPPTGSLPLMDQVPVYDQGQLGSCTANMGCGMFRYLEVRAGRPPLDISRMSLYKATRTLEGTPLTEDSGAQIRDVMTALRYSGVALEADDPYVDDGKQFTLPITSNESVDAAGHRALFYYRLIDLHTIKASILQGFGVGFGFAVYSSMMSDDVARTGLVPYPTNDDTAEGGHAVWAHAFDDTKLIAGETGGLLIRNSWGRGWGQQGDAWLPQAYVTTGLATDFWSLRSVEL